MTAVSAAKTVHCTAPQHAGPSTRPHARLRKRVGERADLLWSQPAAHCSLSPWLVTQVATGSDLQGGGVFSFIKAKG